MLSLVSALALAALPAAPKVQLHLQVPATDAGSLCYPSGLQVRLEQRPGTGLASTTMVLDGGTSLETDATRSAAHVVEHLWFQSTPDGGPRLWDRAAGLALDATTRRDATTYSAVGATADLDGLLALDAARLRDPLQGIDEATLAREAAIVRSELGLRGEHGGRLALQQLDAVLYPEGHPYHGSITTSGQVDALTLESLQTYVEQAYRPERVTLSVVADLPLQRQQVAVEAALGELLEGPGTPCGGAPSKAAPAAPDTAPVQVKGAVWQPRVYVGFPLPAGWSGGDVLAAAAVERLDSLVRGRMGFVRGLRGDKQAATGCHYLPGREASSATCLVVLPDGVQPSAVVDAIRGVLDEQTSKTDRDLHARRVGVAYAVTDAFQSAASDADRWSTDALTELALRAHRGAGTSPAQVIEPIFSVTEPDVAAFAGQWLTPDRMAVLVMLPEGAASDAAPPVPPVTALPDPATPAWAAPPTGSSVASATLPNGLTVLTAEHPAAVTSHAAMVSDGGWARGPIGAEAVHERIVGYQTPIGFVELAAGMGLRFWQDESPWAVTLGNMASVANTDMQMWVHRMMVDSAVTDPAAVQGAIDDSLAWAIDELPRWPMLHIDHVQRQHLYGDDRLATTHHDRLAAARKLKTNDMLAWHRHTVRPDATTLVVATADPASAKAQAERYLGTWKVKPSKLEVADPAPPAPPERAIVGISAGTRFATVDVTCRVKGPGAGRAAALEVLEAALRQASWVDLREKAGAYAPEVLVRAQTPDEALLSLMVDVPPAQAASALDALLAELRLAQDGVGDGLLAWAIRDAQGAEARAAASTTDHIDRLVARLADGADPAALEGFAEALGQVTAADLTALLAPCVGHEAAVVVGPEDALSGLEGATRYDAAVEGKAWADSLD